jgi:hypothetical protein
LFASLLPGKGAHGIDGHKADNVEPQRANGIRNLLGTRKPADEKGKTQEDVGSHAGNIKCLPETNSGKWEVSLADMVVHLIDGTYELYRHFYGQRSFNKGKDKPFGAVVGVLNGVLQMIEEGATHVGVATDHVIESFRNDLWPGYKTGEGIERPLLKQFHPLEDALASMGVAVWRMVELEADDALASAAHLADADPRVIKVCIWTPDKDLAQCVVKTVWCRSTAVPR